MTRDEVLALAKKADLWMTSDERIAAVERFAALVAAHEREECAKLVEADPAYDWHRFACEAAAAIRSRE